MTVQLTNEVITATISTDQDIHPDMCDDFVKRCESLFIVTWIAYPDDDLVKGSESDASGAEG